MIFHDFGFGSQFLGFMFSAGLLSFSTGIKSKLIGIGILGFCALQFMGTDLPSSLSGPIVTTTSYQAF